MPGTEPTSARLEALRARWEANKGSRVFLQLADEYRRLGRNADAAEVLEEGLRANPSHPAARVALGRCQLDLGRSAEAIRELETVIEADPTQMVAYRLLVEAYLRQGRAELARQRLRVYSLLNDADPEIAELRRRIGEIERQDEGDGTVVPPAPPPILAPAETGEPPEEPEGMSEPPQPPPEAARFQPAPAASEAEPFPALAGDEGDRRRYLSALAGGGVFELPVPEEAEAEEEAPAAAEEPPAEAAPPVPEPLGEAPEAPEAPAPGADVFDLGAPSAPPTSDLSSLLEPEAAPPPEAPGRATVTLGRLYLRQGHLGEAAAIFHEVLARDPDNAEARRGLEELALRERPELRAADLLGGYAGREGLTDRKRFVLERYLERLRGRAPGDVH